MNWKIRFANPAFWASVAIAFVSPILVHAGANWADMTTWPTLFHYIFSAFQSPVVFVAIIVSLWNCVQDPTTFGISDSQYAKTKESCKE